MLRSETRMRRLNKGGNIDRGDTGMMARRIHAEGSAAARVGTRDSGPNRLRPSGRSRPDI